MADNTVLLTALAIVASCVAGLVWALKFLLKEFRHSLDKNAAAQEKVAVATKANTAVSKENLVFLQNLNGSLRKVVVEKQEQAKLEG